MPRVLSLVWLTCGCDYHAPYKGWSAWKSATYFDASEDPAMNFARPRP
jgi:hypothetical protein